MRNHHYELVPIPGVEEGSTLQIFALGIDGKSDALDFIVHLSESNRDDYKQIMKSMNLVAQYGSRVSPLYFKPLKRWSGVFEFKTKHTNARLICFLHGDSMIICVSGALKTDSDREQNAAIEKCRTIRDEFIRRFTR